MYPRVIATKKADIRTIHKDALGLAPSAAHKVLNDSQWFSQLLLGENRKR